MAIMEQSDCIIVGRRYSACVPFSKYLQVLRYRLNYYKIPVLANKYNLKRNNQMLQSVHFLFEVEPTLARIMALALLSQPKESP